MSKKQTYECWFCGKELNDSEEGVEFTWEFDSYLHLDCLTDFCGSIMPSEVDDYANAEAILIMNEMNEKGYDIQIGEEE